MRILDRIVHSNDFLVYYAPKNVNAGSLQVSLKRLNRVCLGGGIPLTPPPPAHEVPPSPLNYNGTLPQSHKLPKSHSQ